MSQFDESKLSRILARRIIAPEDRSQFLPLCTPIYCPDNNGVKASQVTIIDPNLNTFFDDADPTSTRSKYIGSQINSKGVGVVQLNPNISTVGSVNISNDGIASSFSAGNYLLIDKTNNNFTSEQTIAFTTSDLSGTTEMILTDELSGVRFMISSGQLQTRNNAQNRDVILISNLQPNTKYYIKAVTENNSGSITVTIFQSADGTNFNNRLVSFQQAISENENYVVTYGAFKQDTASSARLEFKGTIDLVNTTRNGVPLATVKSTVEVTRQPNEVQNIINVDLNRSVSRDYFVPYEVELKSDADIMSVIKSDFAAYFKNRVSNEIIEQLVLLHTTNAISTINKGASLAATLGDVISTFISQGTGQKFSIYKYNNGAPVVYSVDSNQPNIDKDINQTTDMTFVTKDAINVPALYYVEQPTLILPNATFADYQTELCNGTIKEYARKMVNVETATANFGQLGEGVFGTNDTFAVAFSSPSIKLVPDTNFYGYRLCCTMLYGVKLVHKHNLRLIV